MAAGRGLHTSGRGGCNEAFDQGMGSVGVAIRRIGENLRRWDREVLGELKGRIKRAKKELERCRRSKVDQYQVSQEHLLKYKLHRLEDQHNLYWQQRAHANRLKKGEQNTSFFHAHASERRSINVITKLKR